MARADFLALMLPLCAEGVFAMEDLCRSAPNAGSTSEALALLDAIYLAAGFGVLALMALYAYACDRL